MSKYECRALRIGSPEGQVRQHDCKRDCLPPASEQLDKTIWQCSCGKVWAKRYWLPWWNNDEVDTEGHWTLLTRWERWREGVKRVKL